MTHSLQHVPPGTLQPWAKNPRRIAPDAVLRLATSIRELGWGRPILARPSDRTIVAGHRAHQAALLLGLEEVPVVWREVSDAELERLAIADNAHAEGGVWDDVLLGEILRDQAAAGYDVDLLGLAEAQLVRLLSEDQAAPVVVPEAPRPPPVRRDALDEVEVEDLGAPFPWFGGKRLAAGAIWHALGDVENYVEPFAGSLAALLARPGGPGKVETVNDADGLLVNWWRAVRAAPDEVAEHADWPVSEADLTARHVWLVGQRGQITERLVVDPDWYDARAAGWWAWGLCGWIGSGWCSGRGPWVVEDGALVKGGGGEGVRRKLPHLGNAGRGVNRQLPRLDADGGVHRVGREPLVAWFGRLAERLRRVRITCGGWSRVTTPPVCERHGLTGVLLDPPYPEGWDPDAAYSAQEGGVGELWAEVREGAVDLAARGCRVVVCGYEGTWEPPSGWTTRQWHARQGYAKGDERRHREVLWCSPLCVPPSGAAP